jgi:antitoxin ParD1/3/4
MNINFPPVDEGYIKAKVEGGYYSNATELVRDAVRRLRELDDKHARLLMALELGECDIAAGRTAAYTPGLLGQIEQEARAHAAQGTKPDADVMSSASCTSA